MLVAGRPRSVPAGDRPPAGVAPGSEVSLRQLLEHVDVERLVSDELLQPRVLALEFLEPLRLVGLHPAVLRTPTIPAALGDLELPQHVGEFLALVQQPVALAQLAHDLLRRVPLPLHRDALHPSMLGVGLSRKVDHYPGGPPILRPIRRKSGTRSRCRRSSFNSAELSDRRAAPLQPKG